MNKELLEKRLKSIGKEIFVEYFEEFRDTTIRTQDLANKLLKENQRATSFDAQKTRISNARKIFELKMEKVALDNIFKSERVNINIREKANRIANTIANL